MYYDSRPPTENEILSVLPRPDSERLLSSSRLVKLSLGQVMSESNARLESIYFPTTSVVSLIYTMQDGASAEIAVIGNDGMIGLPVLLGGVSSPNQAVILIAGEAICIRGKLVEDEFLCDGPLRRLLLRYLHSFITQVSLTAACNRLHSMEQRLTRLLLLCQDRTQLDDLPMTQEFIAQTLGGRRETVSVAAGQLQDAGLIQYSRGHIRILDHMRLRANACECYETMKVEGSRSLATASISQECVS